MEPATNETRTFIFQDRKARKWDVTLTVAGARRIDNSDFSALTAGKFSILKPDKALFSEILSNGPLLTAMVFAIVQPQVKDNLGVDPKTNYEEAEETFVESLDGTALEEMRESFWGTLSDFFPEHRTALLTLLRQWKKARDKIGEEIKGMEAEVETIIGEEIETKMRKIPGEVRREFAKTNEQ